MMALATWSGALADSDSIYCEYLPICYKPLNPLQPGSLHLGGLHRLQGADRTGSRAELHEGDVAVRSALVWEQH